MGTPFRLEIKLATPFAMSKPRTTLDSLLSAAIFRENGAMGADTIPHIPLDQEDGVFKGSCAFIAGNFSHTKVQRIMNLNGLNDHTPDHFAPQSKGKIKRYLAISVKREAYKANLSNHAALDARTVVFFGVGNPERVVELIQTNIPGLGKRANAGAGEIVSVTWQKMDADRSWITPSGLPARPLPLGVWNRISASRIVPIADLTVQVPYWSGEVVAAVYPLEVSV